MTGLDLRGYRRRLTAMAADLSAKVSDLRVEALHPTAAETAGGSAATATGDPGAEEAALALMGTEGHILAEVNAALARLDKRTFGRCEACGRPVARARLDALPYARHCVACARRAEADRTE